MPWTRRDLLRASAASAAFGCRGGAVIGDGLVPDETGRHTGADTGTPIRPPNIVYIYADQHRAPMLGCYGHPDALTPSLDALAAESVLFERCFTNSPLCRPARATMMTGLLPHLHGCWNNDQLADRSGPSHVRAIRDAGWRTALFGKAHLELVDTHPGDPANLEKLAAWGFDEAVELLSQVTSVEKPNAYIDWLRETSVGSGPDKAQRYADYVNAWEHLDSPPPDQAPTLLGTDDHVDVWCARLAAAWIRERQDDQPFYVQVNFPGPHSPFDSTTEFRNLYDLASIEAPILGPPEAPLGRLVQFLWDTKPELHGLTAEQGRFLRMTYLAKITMIDMAIGELMAALADAGRLDDTWVVYGADHGELVGDHELWGKIAMYEGSVRIPLIVRPPGGTDPWRIGGKVDQMDVTATLLAIAGQTGPGPGRSLLDQIVAGPAAPGADQGQDSVVAEVAGHPNGSIRSAMLRDDRYKLVYDLDNGRPDELYDLEADPEERANVVADPGYNAVASRLRDDLLARLEP